MNHGSHTWTQTREPIISFSEMKLYESYVGLFFLYSRMASPYICLQCPQLSLEPFFLFSSDSNLLWVQGASSFSGYFFTRSSYFVSLPFFLSVFSHLLLVAAPHATSFFVCSLFIFFHLCLTR